MAIETTKILTELSTAKRHVVRINGIEAQKEQYQKNNILKSKELISSPVRTLSFFANEYVPEHFPASFAAIRYIMTVNGQDHDMVPINVQRGGKKIIRTTDYNSAADHILYFNEEIKSATLTIILQCPGKFDTPYVSNIKILAGGE